jgi:RNA polymerase sigma-70 factor, ECF subfamily
MHEPNRAFAGDRLRGHISETGGIDLDTVQANCEIHSQNYRERSSQQTRFEKVNSRNASIAQQNNIVISESIEEMSDKLLVLAARSGDCTAFVKLCERHSKRILRKLYRITKNWEDAEDALQDSLLKAFIHLKKFEGRSSFSSWLTRIAINSALMLLRKKRGLEVSIDHASDDAQTWWTWELQDHSETPESHYARREREELLRSAIRRLPTTFRKATELRLAREYSTSEIARELGISESAAKSRLLRARMAVRASFAAMTP